MSTEWQLIAMLKQWSLGQLLAFEMLKTNFDTVFLIKDAGSALVHSYWFIRMIQVVLEFKSDSCSFDLLKS